MAAVTSTSEHSYLYSEKAIGEFSWEKHPKKGSVAPIKLTITPTIKAALTNDGHLHLRFVGQPLAGLSAKAISSLDTQGPYMDILSSSIQPKTQGIFCSADSLSGAPIQEILSIAQTTSTFNAGMGGNAASMGIPTYGGAGNFGYAFGSNKSQQTKAYEFELTPLIEHSRRQISYHMTKCYDGDTALLYDTDRVWNLRNSVEGQRLAAQVAKELKVFPLPIAPLFWINVPRDKTYTPPLAARTTFSSDWVLEFSIPNNVDVFDFDYTTEVRTVFASTAEQVPYPSSSGDRLSWIKTIHRVTQCIQFDISDKTNMQMQALSTDEKMVCASGYEGTTKSIKLINKDGAQKEISLKEVTKEFCHSV